MTAVTAGLVRPPSLAAGAAVGAGALLLARPWLTGATPHDTAVLLAVFAAVGVAGVLCAVPAEARVAPGRSATAGLVCGAGVATFALGRLLGGGEAPTSALASVVVLNAVAAVAEEALFRRLVYGLLLPYGAGVAVIGSAAAFAAVHVTVWGAWALPIDLAAGLVLSWQRWASGRWSVPAVTHVAANVLAVV